MTDTGPRGRAATDSDPHGHHDWHSAAYVDGWISNDVTHDDSRRPKLRSVAKGLGFGVEDRVRVLDIGGGYGVFSAEILDEWPHAEVVLHDFSIPMTDQARSRLAEFRDRVAFYQGDLRQPDWAAGVGGPFDAVVSSLAIHNVRDPLVIRRVYGDIAGLVRPGGCFMNVDSMAVPGPRTARAYGRDPSRVGAEEVRATLANQLTWLTEAGFDEVDCLWKQGTQACLAAFRGPASV
jgi:tRNA (cmo5U34)-methyltransferase